MRLFLIGIPTGVPEGGGIAINRAGGGIVRSGGFLAVHADDFPTDRHKAREDPRSRDAELAVREQARRSHRHAAVRRQRYG